MMKATDSRRIDELVRTKARGMTAGICGREFCEACGREGNFSGFWGAYSAHSYDGRFVCWDCRAGELAGGGGMKTADYAKLDALILDRGFRYCAGCGAETKLDEATPEEGRRRPFTCETCGEIDIGSSARRRYLEHQAQRPGGLDRAESRIRWAQEGIERMEPNQDE